MSAYAIGHLEHVNMGTDIVQYLQQIDATLAPFGGRFLIHGDPIDVLEGNLEGDIIVIEFPDIGDARQWYTSPAYRAILPLRTANSIGTVFLVPGVSDDHIATDVLRRQ
ncbi:DUF1330 domain-containing protein [Candidimonas sp. SYP-B2681]|uniref:DUF1330 domain-containing protein n=1 Tax=Candidimonas sp. SYP-B2681 TaxID=2497686 RepID=UPI000F89955B|nr:DUF1330 domain-containing protein [Candidimonas sp. SYP-B2681]RTZ45543.1 DUF1330 domain-containing protein [Candidimonas sp. SYP-B2681]